jgi:hypothetical protein
MRISQEVQKKHIGGKGVNRVSLESKPQGTLTADTDDSEPEMPPSNVSVLHVYNSVMLQQVPMQLYMPASTTALLLGSISVTVSHERVASTGGKFRR